MVDSFFRKMNALAFVMLFAAITLSGLISTSIMPTGITTLNFSPSHDSISPNVIMGGWLSACAGTLLGIAKYILEVYGPGLRVQFCMGVSLGIASFVYLGILFLGTTDDLLICLPILGISIYFSMLGAGKIAAAYRSLETD
jgi:hypothetical protein